MSTTTITTNSNKKFNQILNFLNKKRVSILPSLEPLSITFITKSPIQTNSLLHQLTKNLHLSPLQPSLAHVA